MRRTLTVLALLAVAAVGAAVAYQAAARERDYRLLLARGDQALRTDETFGAIEAYSGAIALRPDSMLAHLRRGETYRRRNDLDNAARDFRTAAALDPSAPRALEEWADVLYEQQRFRRAAELYEQRLKLDERAPGVIFRLALARYRDHNLDGALAAVEQALRLNDRLADAYYLRGMCLRDKHDPKGALRAFEAAVERDPGLIPAREELADLYGALGRRNDELEQLQLLAGLDRDHVERQVALGLAHARAARAAHDEPTQERQANLAILTLTTALDRTPDQPQVYGALGTVWMELATSRNDPVDLRKGIQALERAATTTGATSQVLALYGRALARDKQLEAAEAVLREASQRFPVDTSGLLDYAEVAERLNHLEAARAAYIEYAALSPADDELVGHATRIAALSMRLDDPQTAIAWLTRAAAAAPEDAAIAAALADARARQERLTTAPSGRDDRAAHRPRS